MVNSELRTLGVFGKILLSHCCLRFPRFEMWLAVETQKAYQISQNGGVTRQKLPAICARQQVRDASEQKPSEKAYVVRCAALFILGAMTIPCGPKRETCAASKRWKKAVYGNFPAAETRYVTNVVSNTRSKVLGFSRAMSGSVRTLACPYMYGHAAVKFLDHRRHLRATAHFQPVAYMLLNVSGGPR